MAIPHARPGHPMDVRSLGTQLTQRKTSALFKSQDLELIQLILLAGHSLPPHRVPGGITIQCIEGSMQIDAEGQSHVLHAGQLLYLEGRVMHAVTAREDASALVTIALKPREPSPDGFP